MEYIYIPYVKKADRKINMIRRQIKDIKMQIKVWNGINRLETSEDQKISGCEDITIETSQTEAQKIERLKK